MKRIHKGDTVKIMTGANKGQVTEVERVDGTKVYLKGINQIERHYRATSMNQGGKRDIVKPIDISNVALVADGADDNAKVSKVKFVTKDDKKVRVAKLTNKEVK